MKYLTVPTALFVVGLLSAVPALAQTTLNPASPSPTTPQKQHTDGGDSPYNPRAFDGAAAWRKLHPYAQAPLFGARRQQTQSLAHSAAPAGNGTVTVQQ
jgi:hypothetical protein